MLPVNPLQLAELLQLFATILVKVHAAETKRCETLIRQTSVSEPVLSDLSIFKRFIFSPAVLGVHISVLVFKSIVELLLASVHEAIVETSVRHSVVH